MTLALSIIGAITAIAGAVKAIAETKKRRARRAAAKPTHAPCDTKPHKKP